MIVDNADDIEILNSTLDFHIFNSCPPDEHRREAMLLRLSHYIPDCYHGSILFTSRDRNACVDLAEPATYIQVDTMGLDECKLIFDSSLRESQDDESVSKLILALDYLPLALSQAAAYMAKGRISAEGILNCMMRAKHLEHDFSASGS